jgi:predicted Zn-dependent protease
MLSRSADALNVAGGLQYLAIQKINGHGQNAERDADHAGVILARKAGYNPVGALTVMERFARDEKARPDIEQGIFRTHPPSRERATAMIGQITSMGLPVNRRDVTNAIRASTRTAEAADARVHEVIIDGKVMFRAASLERAKEAAEAINRLLDENLQINEVRKSGTEVTARRRTIISVRPDDAALAQGVSAEAMADQAYQVLRTALWKQFLEEN